VARLAENEPDEISAREREILRRINWLHQVFWLLVAGALVAPLPVAIVMPPFFAAYLGLILALGALFCAVAALRATCPRCGSLFHSRGAGLAEFRSGRCQQCATSCRNPDEPPG
jgi:hypothetical protein